MEILEHWCFFNLLILPLIFIPSVSAVDPLSEALLSLKSELIDNSNSLSDWFVPSGENPSGKIFACTWSGVKCNTNSTIVIGLDFSLKNLGGAISGKLFTLFVDLLDLNLSYNSFSEQLPVGIFNLTNLRTLDISRNNFSGHFPNGISNLQNLVVLDAFSNSFSGPLPAEVSQLQSLQVLNLAGSYFSGPIPSEYGSFKSLDFIHLAGNFLGGKIPSELGMLQTVTHMEIGYNSYQGSIPWQLGNMSELNYLDIADANLSGSIPEQLSNLTKLGSLFLFKNQLSGLIPWELSKSKALKSLDLSDNLLSGTIPESFAELKSLKLLSVMCNYLNGTVPEGIAQLPELDTLLLWSNFFSGSLPEDLGRHTKLKYVDVSTNSFVGAIPPDICSGGQLLKLILFSNNFTGSLSPSLSNCSSLVRLRLEDNAFTGKIPLNFSNLNDISYVDLSRNMFVAGIPSDVAKASNLEYFNVSNNSELGGKIPEKIFSLPVFQNFSASSCKISGTIPSFEYCKSVLEIELSMNNLSGNVPENILNCQSLVRVDLADNNLTGHIPVELAGLPAISVIDLSHNSFNGPIPMKLGKSSSLQLLNVSYNDISGSIPSQKTFKMMDSSAFLGNPKLCGAPLRPCQHANEISNGLELGSKRTQKLAWVLILCAVVVLLITLLVFGLIYYRQGSQGQWKMVSFSGLPQFTANDILRSFDSADSMETVPPMSASVCKAVLPTGITVLVKRVEWEPKRMDVMSEFIHRMGNSRHRNLTRLLGFCYNKHLAYVLYDYLPNGNLSDRLRMKRDWAAKYKIVMGIARGLCFLHHDCHPPIPHGDLKATNIVFDENMEPHLAEFGFRYLLQLNKNSYPATISMIDAGELDAATKEQLYMDVYNFGEVVLEILTDGRLANARGSIHSKPKDVLLREIYSENDAGSSSSTQQEIKLVVEVALQCTRCRPSDRPFMEDALKLLSGLKPESK